MPSFPFSVSSLVGRMVGSREEMVADCPISYAISGASPLCAYRYSVYSHLTDAKRKSKKKRIGNYYIPPILIEIKP